MVTLITVAGLRRNIGDTYFYRHSYEISNFPLSKINFKGEFGFYYFQHVLHQISDNPQILVFTSALITYILIICIFYKYSRMFEVCLFVFIASGYFTTTMNGIRQSLAAAIVFAAIKFILDGHWKKFFAVVLVAATIHQSALIFLPIYFIVRRKAWTKVTFLLLLASVGIAFGFNTFSSLLFDALENTKYSAYNGVNEGGANIIRVLVTATPLVIAYFGRERLRELWPKSDIIVNLSLLNLIFMIVATKNWIFARFDIYFELYNFILMSWIILLFTKKDRAVIYYGLIGCYLVYFFYEQVVTLNLDYRSDYLHFFGG